MFTNILVPLDGSDLAAKVLPAVVELAKNFNSQVTLFHSCHSEAFGEASPGVLATVPVWLIRGMEFKPPVLKEEYFQ